MRIVIGVAIGFVVLFAVTGGIRKVMQGNEKEEAAAALALPSEFLGMPKIVSAEANQARQGFQDMASEGGIFADTAWYGDEGTPSFAISLVQRDAEITSGQAFVDYTSALEAGGIEVPFGEAFNETRGATTYVCTPIAVPEAQGYACAWSGEREIGTIEMYVEEDADPVAIAEQARLASVR